MNAALAGLSSASVATAGGDRVGVILGLTPAWPGARVAGEAVTVAGYAGDNLVIHRALAQASPGTVLVAALQGDTAAGHWGELMCAAAEHAGIAGAVIAGTVRDLNRIEARRFPVFHRGVGPRPATKTHPGAIRVPISIHQVPISPDDLVVADADGIVVVPHALAADVLSDVERLEIREEEALREVEGGASTLDVLGLH